MLYIYTSIEEAKKSNRNLAVDIEAQFNLRYGTIIEKYEQDRFALKILSIIEGMKSHTKDTIIAKFGSVSMQDISTGSKGCLLSVLFNDEFVVSTDEMGYNCIHLLCKISKYIDIFILTSTEYTDLPEDTTAFVNNVRCYNKEDILQELEFSYG